MSKPSHQHPSDLHPSDIRALAQLASRMVLGIIDLTESVHHAIPWHPRPSADRSAVRTSGITGLVYRAVRGISRRAGSGIDAVLDLSGRMAGKRATTPRREAVISAVNGMFGDLLAADGNALAIDMQFRVHGQSLTLEKEALKLALPEAGGKILVLIHGLCMNDLQWKRKGHDHGAALARDLGYTPVYLHYNTGLKIARNGKRLAEMLEDLVDEWPQPVSEVNILAHSMGGLVARSAIRCAEQDGQAWNFHLRSVVFLGTPHHGAPLERFAGRFDRVLQKAPYVAALSALGKARSSGIKDLSHGILIDEAREGSHGPGDQKRFPSHVPLPATVSCFTIAATLGKRDGDLQTRLLGDGLVPLMSALGKHEVPGKMLHFGRRQWIAYQTNHMDLLNQPDVYERIRRWLSSGADNRIGRSGLHLE